MTFTEKYATYPRHTNIVTIANEPIARRAFSEWSLHFSDIHSETFVDIDDDLREFIEANRPLIEIGQGKARKLVKAFEAGKWHQPARPVNRDKEPEASSPDFSMAVQPIADVFAREIYSHEALVRGPGGEPAYSVLNTIAPEQMAGFDRMARHLAVRMAADLRLGTALNLNFIPGAAFNLATNLEKTLEVAKACGFPEDKSSLKPRKPNSSRT